MNKFAIAAALPFALTLAACGGTDETNTTTMETDAMAPMDSTTTTDPMVGTDTMTQEPMTDDMTTDPMMDDPTMTDPAATPQP